MSPTRFHLVNNEGDFLVNTYVKIEQFPTKEVAGKIALSSHTGGVINLGFRVSGRKFLAWAFGGDTTDTFSIIPFVNEEGLQGMEFVFSGSNKQVFIERPEPVLYAPLETLEAVMEMELF